jgi:5-methylcytosine-specific restriction enzyme subunit McrC
MLIQGSANATEVLTLFEYEMTDALQAREMKAIEQISRSMGIEILRPKIRQGKLYYQARQYVGVLRLGQRTLQILPKIHDSKDRSQSEQEASRNLLWMMDYAGYLNIRESSLADLKQAQDWFEVLIYLFADNLQRQWIKGASRSYEPVDAVLPVLKGKWRTTAQMRRPEQKHLFAVTYDEFTLDNQLNRVFRYVVEGLWQVTRDHQNRQLLSELRYWMDEVTLLPTMTVQAAQSIQLTRLNRQYEPLLNLARLFLARLGLELSANNLTAFAFVFDMNQLFERFITGFLQRHKGSVLPETLQSCHLLPQGRQAVCYLARYGGKRVFRLKPDLVFRHGEQYPLLMDFKYKHLNPSDRKLGIAEADFYQMYAYLSRFDCPQVILLYPQTASLPEPIRSCFILEGRQGEIQVATVNLLKDLTAKGAKQELIVELRQILEQEANG